MNKIIIQASIVALFYLAIYFVYAGTTLTGLGVFGFFLLNNAVSIDSIHMVHKDCNYTRL